MNRTRCLVLFCSLLAGTRSLAAAEARLSHDVVPTSERVSLHLNPDEKSYSGSVEIKLHVNKPVRSFRFHAERMKLADALLKGKETLKLETVSGDQGTITATATRPIPPGDYELTINFTNEFDTRSVGLYRMEKDGQGYAFTQFEAADARKAFPCWDEPEFKIPYQLTLTIPKGMEAVTNTPIQKVEEKNDWKVVAFQKTRPLPSYLLDITVGRLEFVPIEGMSIPGRVVTIKGQKQLATLAASLTAGIVKAEEAYFGMPYPFEKLDLIAVPEFWPGAMENPGAITFADSVLLLDPTNATAGQRRNFIRTTAHEVAHMWFGDLVTMRWWDDLWLNESFADWMGDKITDQLYPQYKFSLSELAGISGVMQEDAQPSIEPVRHEIAVAENALNDVGVAYDKGKSVIGMFERYLGPEKFRSGVNAYLKANAWKNTESSDFWKALSKSSGKNIAGPMSGFLEQPGLPLVSASILPDGSLQLAQTRFLNYGITAKPEQWQIPVILKVSDGSKIQTRTVLLDQPKIIVNLGTKKLAWVLPNADASGYYRWRVSPEMLLTLAQEGPKAMNARERVSFLGNLSALLLRGEINGGEFLEIVNQFANDPEPQVISSVINTLGQTKAAFVPDSMKEAFANYVRRTLQPALDRFGMEKKAGEEEAVSIFRPRLINWLGTEGHDPKIMSFARSTAEAYMKDTHSVDLAIAGTALRVAALEGDQALYDKYLAGFQAAKTPGERSNYLGALGSFQDPAIREKSLEFALKGKLRPNELFVIPRGLGSTAASRDRLFKWLTDNYDTITSRLPPAFVSFMPNFAAGCEAERLQAAKSFFAQEGHHVEGTEKELQKVTEQVNDCVALRQREGSAVSAYLNGLSAPVN
ncbi:MAG TPA: M1 family metallopeptidase [Thermoanaerobaculia bacterium]|nr:M1 family metallopeptidase [Thermoanaerobaculia bacterium]